ncbi:hypothetical protein TNCT_520931 [Trichonephila clavata]|uniref:C2H2-type domain-containing protein n=1 Tax=Trichonephila clavata TaxID=2740835 RepID=A0A8X6IPC0_TRICU|nr:hypothetical protein TNCT_520931 [Trichonephila clavata]
MMNVLSDILCDTSSLMAPQNFKETLSQNKIMLPQDMASKQNTLHLLGSVSQIPSMERSLTTVNHNSTDLYNTSNQMHVSPNMQTGFNDRTDVSVFSDSFPEIVPSWLTHDFMKVSETLSSPGLLSNVPDIYPARENEHSQMLDLGFSPELSSDDVTSNGLNQTCLTGSQKLVVDLPIQRFSSTDPLLMSSFNDINITELNTIQYQKFKQNPSHLSNSELMNSVLPCENDLLHLPLHSNLTDQCLTTTSSPSMMSNSQSQSHPVDVVCDKLPHINLNNLDSFLGSEAALSDIQLLPQNFPNVGIPNGVNCSQSNRSCLTNCGPDTHQLSCETGNFYNPNVNSLPSTQDISVQTSENPLINNLLENHCLSCSQVNPSAAIDVIQCYKCRFCDFVNLHKCAIESHINSIHSNPHEEGMPMVRNGVSPSSQISVVSNSPITTEGANHMNFSKSNSTTVTMPFNSAVAKKDVPLSNNTIQNNEHFQCMKCNKLFSEAIAYNSHMLSCQNLNTELSQNILQTAEHYQCVKCCKLFSDINIYASHLVSEHNLNPKSVLINNKNITYGYNLKPIEMNSNQPHIQEISGNYNSNIIHKDQSSPKSNLKQTSMLKKADNVVTKSNPKEVDDILKKSNAKKDDALKKSYQKKTNNEVANSNSEKPISSFKKAWQKKLKRELGSYICEFKGCNVRFRALDNLEYHNKCHVSGGSIFACPECGMTFESWATIAGHLWRIHKNDMELQKCDQCSFRTYSLSRLENIHKKIHSEECSYLCDTCGKKFKNGKQMRNHRVHHFNKRKRNVKEQKCMICSTVFPSKVLLHHHQDTVHNIKHKKFICSYCDYTSIKRSTLALHMRQHTGEKPFKCDQCDYCTSDHNSLRRHKMKHSGERKYKCPYCPYSAIQASTYKSHFMKKHPDCNGIMFSCNICSFQTLKHESYVLHMKDHESLSLLQRMNSMNEINATDEIFPLAEAMDISLSNGDNNLISHLNKDKSMQSYFNNLGINMVSVCQESAT